MVKKSHGHGHGNGNGNGGDGDDDNGRKPYDDPGEHREIERRRFEGSLPATPERYARAREQWYRLPGALVRPTMDPIVDLSDEPPAPPAGGGANASGGHS